MQTQDMQKPEFELARQRLNLVPNEDGVLKCPGHILGKHLVADASKRR